MKKGIFGWGLWQNSIIIQIKVGKFYNNERTVTLISKSIMMFFVYHWRIV